MNWTGLAAKVWDASGGDNSQWDQDFIRELIERQQGPALDIGCGTGRLLNRYLQAGLDVDGIDTSADMLELCRAKAARQGLQPTLAQQPMEALAMPRRYRTIFIACGTFCLIIEREQAFEALRRMYAHLEPGGVLLLSLFWPYADREALSAEPLGVGDDWQPMMRHTLPDGSEMIQHYWRQGLNRAEQVLLALRRYRHVVDGQIVAEEVFHSHERWYFKYEMQLMLESVGFVDVAVKGDYTAEDFADGHTMMVFLATRPS